MIEWPWLHMGQPQKVLRVLPEGVAHAVISCGVDNKEDRKSFRSEYGPLFRYLLRACRPGAHFVCSVSPVRAHWVCYELEGSGWEIRDRLSFVSRNESVHWVIARAPLSDHTVSRNVLSHDAGAINAGACRYGEKQRWPANFVMSHLNGCGDVCESGCIVSELRGSEYFDCMTMKELLSWFVRLTTRPKQVVLDISMVSGCVGIACGEQDRKFIGISTCEEDYRTSRQSILKVVDINGAKRPKSRQGAISPKTKRARRVLNGIENGGVL